MDPCEKCGRQIEDGSDHWLCRRCVENRESSLEDVGDADCGPMTLDEQCHRARNLKEGRES